VLDALHMLRALELCSGGKKASDTGTLEEHLPQQSKDRPESSRSSSVIATSVCNYRLEEQTLDDAVKFSFTFFSPPFSGEEFNAESFFLRPSFFFQGPLQGGRDGQRKHIISGRGRFLGADSHPEPHQENGQFSSMLVIDTNICNSQAELGGGGLPSDYENRR
jgi:hypothetical protein